jgi:hypothetical protein
MNIQELKDFFAKSDYSEETKSVIAQVLADKIEVTPGLVSHVKDILQKELDSDFKELGVDAANDPELQKAEKEYIAELDTIEKDLKSDMGFVEKELKDLEDVRKEVTKISDEIEADKLAGNIKQSMSQQ